MPGGSTPGSLPRSAPAVPSLIPATHSIPGCVLRPTACSLAALHFTLPAGSEGCASLCAAAFWGGGSLRVRSRAGAGRGEGGRARGGGARSGPGRPSRGRRGPKFACSTTKSEDCRASYWARLLQPPRLYIQEQVQLRAAPPPRLQRYAARLAAPPSPFLVVVRGGWLLAGSSR